MADTTPLLEEGTNADGKEEEEKTLMQRLKQRLAEQMEVGMQMKKVWELPILTAAFFVGYYADVFMELYSAWQMFQTPETVKLGFALLFILFISPTMCWLLLLSNNLESVLGAPLYAMHVMPIIEVRKFVPKWMAWKEIWDEAEAKNIVRPLPLVKTPALTWLPVCKSVFSSSLTLLFKVYGSLLQARNYVDGTNTQEPALFGVFISVGFSVASMSYSIVKLSYYGLPLGMVKMGTRALMRFVEIFSRVTSIGMLGMVFVEQHSIMAVLGGDFALQLLLLLLHPAPRKLLRNGMAPTILIFWAMLMTLCAPPLFIPQLADLHPVYFALRTAELAFILGASKMRCGWPGTPAPAAGAPALVAACKLVHPESQDIPFWAWALIVSGYVAALALPMLALAQLAMLVKRWLDKQRLRQYREEQKAEAGKTSDAGHEPLRYGECIYLRVSSIANRFLVSKPGAEPAFEAVEMPLCTEEDMKNEEFVPRAAWHFVPTSETKSQLVKFGDLLKIRSDAHVDRFLSGGRRGNNTYVGTHIHIQDMQQFILDYDLDEHYNWRIVAVHPQRGPDPTYRAGQSVDLLDHFALQAMPAREELGLFLTGCRGPTTDPNRKEVWTAPLHSRAAFEDLPLEGRWPSFEFFAQRRPMVDSSSITQLIDQVHNKLQERGAALATAGHNEDIMMHNFMMQSGVPMNVTDEQYFTPLHHFVLQYAREGDHKMLKAAEEGREDQAFEVDHKVPFKIFQSMLHTGLLHLELGAKAMYTPLHLAALLGERELCDALLEAGADLNVGDSDGWTCLHDAVLYGHKEMLKYLLNQPGLDPNSSTRSGVRPIDLTEDREVLGWLTAKGAKSRGSGLADVASQLPPMPEGAKFFTHFVDPRENKDLRVQTCHMDNQHLVAKFLAVAQVPSGNGPCCFFCVRFAWSQNIGLCPLFKCPGCAERGRIPYFDSEWSVCWVCHTCGTFPHWMRVETGKVQYGSGKAQQLFVELDTDGSSTLSKEEFVAFFKRLDGFAGGEQAPGGEYASELPASSEYAEKVFAKIDANGDGSISFLEFKAFFGVHDFEEGCRVEVTEDFMPLVDPELQAEGLLPEKRKAGMKAEVVVAGLSGRGESLSFENACVLQFEDGYCLVDELDMNKVKLQDSSNQTSDANAARKPSLQRRKTSATRGRQRTTFSCLPCVESCLLLA